MKYARIENETITVYNNLPKHVFEEGKYVSITPENAYDYGFKELTIPSFDSRTHQLTRNIITDNNVFTYEVASLNKTLDDFKKDFRVSLKNYWKEAYNEGKPYLDYLSATEQSVPEDVQTKINSLYSLLDTIKNKIEALETVEEALSYELPLEDIQQGLDFLRGLI